VSISLGMMIEVLVALLLVITIGYCVMLNKRLARLKADEQTLKATISELITATEIAERAISGLKLTVQECDQGLGQRLKVAEGLSSEIAAQIMTGENILAKLSQIAGVARPIDSLPAVPTPVVAGAQATVAAAQAFSLRARIRAQGVAA
jgi:hypothetical protein